MYDNPYQAPGATVVDPVTEFAGEGEFLGVPQSREAGAGARWLADAWRLFKASPGIWIAIILALGGGAIALQFIPVAGAILSGLLYPLLTAGLMLGCDALNRGRPLRFNHLFAGFGDRLAPLLHFSVLYFVVSSAVSAAVWIPMLGLDGYLGFMGGEVEGIDMGAFWFAFLINMIVSIPLFCAYWLALPLITLNQMDPLAAVKLSLLGCLKNVLPLIVLSVLSLLMMIVAVIPLGLGMLIALPMLFASMYTSYRDIFYPR